MKGIVVSVSGELTVRDFDRPIYTSVGAFINGCAEHVRPQNLPSPYCMFVDEDFLSKYPITKKYLNEIGCWLYKTHIYGSPILGTFVIFKDTITTDGVETVGLDDEDITYLNAYLKKVFSFLRRKNND